jgi:hypothetical protein
MIETAFYRASCKALRGFNEIDLDRFASTLEMRSLALSEL